jgi:hypothetical protein
MTPEQIALAERVSSIEMGIAFAALWLLAMLILIPLFFYFLRYTN